jgi:hypothetical protein
MWNWMVTALSLGTTLVLYEGSPLHPHPGALWDLVMVFTIALDSFLSNFFFIRPCKVTKVLCNHDIELEC